MKHRHLKHQDLSLAASIRDDGDGQRSPSGDYESETRTATVSKTTRHRGEWKFHYHPAALGEDITWLQPVPCKPREPKAAPQEAAAEYSASRGRDAESGAELLSVTGTITAATEMMARAKLATLLGEVKKDGNPAWSDDTDLTRNESTLSMGEDGMVELEFTCFYRRNSTNSEYDPAKEALKWWLKWVGIATLSVVVVRYLIWLHEHFPGLFPWERLSCLSIVQV